MTTTELSRSASDIRRLWVDEIEQSLDSLVIDAGGQDEIRSGRWLALLERIRVEGPELARADNDRWQRRFRFINISITRQRDIDWIVLSVLRDLKQNV